MTYSSGGLIQATDFNGFVSTGTPDINDIWSTGATDSGWGQTALSTVSAGGTVTATNWASLVNTLASMGSQTGTTITSRSAPTAGQTISVLAAVATDITNCNTNRGNAANAGTLNQSFTGTTSKTTATGTGTNAWTITFTHTVSFPSAAEARYFWNAGGIVRVYYNKSSTGTDNDPDWNTFVGKVGSLAFVGRVNGAAQTIGGTSYTGTTRFNGTGATQTTLATTTGWYSLTAGAAATSIFQLNDDVSPYTGDYILTTVAKNAGATTLTFSTTWNSSARAGAGQSTNISGGTNTGSPYSGFGTAPTTMVLIQPPSTTYLSASWGTPTVTASVA
jgi:hypothetical protein